MSEYAETEDAGMLTAATSLGAVNEARKQSPMTDAIIRIDKALSGLDMNVESLDAKLGPVMVRMDEAQKAIGDMPDRAPSSDLVNTLNDFATRITRNAQRIRKMNNQVEL